MYIYIYIYILTTFVCKVAASGAVPIFCERLLTIEFIDVAEQSLCAMHKLSVEHPDVLLRSNGRKKKVC